MKRIFAILIAMVGLCGCLNEKEHLLQITDVSREKTKFPFNNGITLVIS